jgi:hypothetical protein
MPVEPLRELGKLAFNRGAYGEAERRFMQALAVQERALGPEHPDLVGTLENYAILLRAANRPAEANEVESRDGRIKSKGDAKSPVR